MATTEQRSNVPAGVAGTPRPAYSRREAWLFPLALVAILRVFDTLVAAIAQAAIPRYVHYVHAGPELPAFPGLAEPLVGALSRYDAVWYIKIALQGYGWNAKTSAFLPLYPGLLAGIAQPLHLGVLGTAIAGMIIATLCFAGAMLLLYRLLALDFPLPVVRLTLVAIVVFPASFTFMAPYTESPFLLLTVAAIYAARRHRWALAGILAGLATLCRVPGPFLVVLLVVRWAMDQPVGWRELARHRQWRAFVSLLWLAWVPLAVLGIFAVDQLATGHFGASISSRSLWRVSGFAPVLVLAALLVTVKWASHMQFTNPSLDTYWQNIIHNVLDLASVVFFGIIAARGWRRLPRDYAIYAIVLFFFYLSSLSLYGEPLTGFVRYMATLFPISIVLALLGHSRRKPHVTAGYVVICALFLVWHVYWLCSFVTWRWVV